jgi:hypothetical protein
MSKEGQEIWVKTSGTPSARSDIEAKTWGETHPWYFDDRAGHKDIDWADFSNKQKDIVARFTKDLQNG